MSELSMLPAEQAPLPTMAHFGGSAEVEDTINELRRALEGDLDTARSAALHLVTLLTAPAKPAVQAARGGLAPWQMRKIERYIRSHLADPLRLNELADHVCLSVSHFCRAFKDSFGATPHAYVVQLRLELAQELMLTTEEALCQVALACGFADQAHLSKLFRRKLGDSPSAWRRRNRAELQQGRRASAKVGLRPSHTAGSTIGEVLPSVLN